MEIKRRVFKNNKLVRDHAADVVEKRGSIVHKRILDGNEYDKELRIKVIEEAQEVRNAKNVKELEHELADLFEVVDALCEFHQIKKATILHAQEQKRAVQGGFSKRIFIETTEHSDPDCIAYCLAAPDKYPEVIE